jgi:hypothetical protein
VTTRLADALGVALGGVAQKRGLIPRVPDGDRLLAEAAVWLTGEYPDAVRSTHQRTLPGGEAALAVDLHPAVPAFLLTASDEGRVTAVAETGIAGPGYHRFVGRLLERLSAQLAIDWTDGDGATASSGCIWAGSDRSSPWRAPGSAAASGPCHWACRPGPAS